LIATREMRGTSTPIRRQTLRQTSRIISGDDVGRQLVFQIRDPVLQHELALLQALDLQLVAGYDLLERLDRPVEIAMLFFKPRELCLKLSLVIRVDVQRHSSTIRHAPLCIRGERAAEYARAARSRQQQGWRTFRQCSAKNGFDAGFSCGTLRLSETETGETDMALQNDLSELERKHQALKREIKDEMSHPGADDIKVATLKRRKLQLKDEIEQLRRSDQRSIH
jgi:hypothetical protein